MITLFADNIILTLAVPNVPKESLPAVYKLLNLFNSDSYYKVNESKSNILGIFVPVKMKSSLQSQFLYPWTRDNLSYLGITLTSPTFNLYKQNYLPLLTSMQQD